MGVLMLAIYAGIAQVMLVNFLITMMGDSYENVKDNSQTEWKFARYSLVVQFANTIADPPPFNLILDPSKKLYALINECCNGTDGSDDQGGNDKSDKIHEEVNKEDITKIMRKAMQGLIDDASQNEEQTLASVGEKIQSQLKTENHALRKRLNAVENKLDCLAKDQRSYFESIKSEIRKAGPSSLSQPYSEGVGRKSVIVILLKVYETGKEYIVATSKHWMVGKTPVTEIPTVFMDQGYFVGDAAVLLETKAGLKITIQNVIDLSGLAFSETPGNRDDESLQVYLYRRAVSAQSLHELNIQLRSAGGYEQMALQLIDLQEVHRYSFDSKLFSALYLYQTMLRGGRIQDV